MGNVAGLLIVGLGVVLVVMGVKGTYTNFFPSLSNLFGQGAGVVQGNQVPGQAGQTNQQKCEAGGGVWHGINQTEGNCTSSPTKTTLV